MMIKRLPRVMMSWMEIEDTAAISREKPFVNRTCDKVWLDFLDREWFDADRLCPIEEDVWTDKTWIC
jgi:hypothetical protein